VVSTVLDLAVNTGGKISHMGGALFGVVYGYYLKKGRDLFDISFDFGRRKKLRVLKGDDNYGVNRDARADDQKMDELLDKISRSGYDSLTKAEKEELFRLSNKK